ncbi:MAG: nucleotidyl transferase AbiEii/AbiGii toxin family protein [Planctomycetaceae bacterium]|nr:MAG: nucleotidyl transferase AbiEii/AbiGii toxin family protein [Planctomycetaceae bacterium]
MSVQMIQQRLLNYNCKTDIEEQQAIREITQEVVLAALGRGDFFKQALFQGGTCLRIFYGLNRFSEDMDFILREAAPDFQLKDHIKHLTDELAAYGYNIEITDRDKADATVKKAFLKDDSLGKVINLRHANQAGPMAQIRIKLEVDTNPPSGSGHELKYLDFPFVSSVAVQDRPSLFAGKIHALLCREYIKGRDWYDFIWYTGNRTGINYDFLTSAINQLGPWQGRSITVNKAWLLYEMERKIVSMNWKQAAEDVRRFVRAAEQPSLDLWSKELFLGQLLKLSDRQGEKL